MSSLIEPDPRYHVDAAARTITILREVANSGPISIAGLTARLSWTKPMVYRLARTLQSCGALRLTDDGYLLGPAIASLGYSALKSFRLPDAARPTLDSIHELTGESNVMTILDGTDAVFVDFREPDRLVIIRVPRLGARLPAAYTSSGHALLSGHSPEDLARLFKDYAFTPPTRRGVTSLQGLQQRLDAVRQTGYAMVDEELAVGHRAVAAPVFDHTGAVAAAISISVPSVRVSSTQLRKMAKEILLPAVSALSADLGYNPDSR